MTPEKAHETARHHLGDRLHWVGRTGPHASEWTVQAVPMSGHMIHATAPTPEEAARAAGWMPTHARLEWERDGDDFALLLCIDALRDRMWSGKLYSNGTGWAYNDHSGWLYNDHPLSRAEIVAAITAWHAAHLPSLHLPPFPETPHAS